MRFTPKSEHEIEAENLLPDGTYDFEVVKAEESTSKKGNPMMKVALKVFAPNGGTPFVYDYLLEAFLGKLLNFCSATGLMANYNSGNLEAHMLEGRGGKVEIITEAQAGYRPRNVVKDYVRGDDASVSSPPSGRQYKASVPASSSDMSDDDIPF